MNLSAGFTLPEFLLFLILGVLLIWVVSLEWRLSRSTRTLRALFAGRRGVDLEQLLRDYAQRVDRADQNLQTLAARLDQSVAALSARTAALEAGAPGNLQHVGVIRYNPFPDKGSDQSFAIALLDGNANGVVVSGIHSRSDSRVYAKPIVGGSSNYALTDEEKQAVQRALGKR